MSLTLIFFLFAYFGGLAYALFRHPIWGLMSYCLSLYMAPSYNWWGYALPNLRWSLLAALVTFISIFINKPRLPRKMPWYANKIAAILICYTVWLWIQLPWALSFDNHLEASILFTKYLFLFYLIYSTLNDDKTFFLFTFFNIFGGGYWGDVVRSYGGSGRVEGIGGPGVNESNVLGMHLVVVTLFAAMMFLKKRPQYLRPLTFMVFKALIVICALLSVNGVVQTISRSAILGLGAAGLLILFKSHKYFKKKVYFYAAVAAMGFFMLTPYTFWNRMNTMKTTVEGTQVDRSAYSRLVIAKAQWQMFLSYPAGCGHRGTIVLSPSFIPPEYLTNLPGKFVKAGRASHCTPMTTLTEQGIIGFLLYIAMIITVTKQILVFKKDHLDNYMYMLMIGASLAAICMAGLFVDYLKVEIQIYCFAMLATLIDYEKRLSYREYMKSRQQVQESGSKPSNRQGTHRITVQ